MSVQPSHSEAFRLETTAAPHVVAAGTSVRRMMADVLVGLLPVTCAAVWLFRAQAVFQLLVCLVTALATEAMFCRWRARRLTVTDGSVAITAIILALSLPPRLPMYATMVGAFVAVALGKMVFGGLGQNIFNPAMVGRAFLLICFPSAMTTWAEPLTVHATTQATPLASAKFAGEIPAILPLITGNVSGSLGETSVVAILLGGSWVLFRRAADWRLTAGMLMAVGMIAVADQWIRSDESSLGWIRHLCAGSVMLGAFFVVTDPVTSPLTKSGRWVFGLGVGTLTMVIRLYAGYPEGVMFSVLLCNAMVPLINRWTTPTPVGGKRLQA